MLSRSKNDAVCDRACDVALCRKCSCPMQQFPSLAARCPRSGTTVIAGRELHHSEILAGSCLSGIPSVSLKAVVQTELHHPRPDSIGRVELLCDLAKIHGVYVLVAYEKARMIEKVVKIRPQIDLLALRDLYRLPNRHII